MAEVAPVIKKRSIDAAFKLKVMQFAEKKKKKQTEEQQANLELAK